MRRIGVAGCLRIGLFQAKGMSLRDLAPAFHDAVFHGGPDFRKTANAARQGQIAAEPAHAGIARSIVGGRRMGGNPRLKRLIYNKLRTKTANPGFSQAGFFIEALRTFGSNSGLGEKGTDMKRILTAILAPVLIVIFILGGLEVGLRVLKIFEPPRKVRTPRPDLYVADESVGYHLWPSTSTYDRYPATSPSITRLVSNSDGFRSGREYGSPGTEKRILVVGDSFVFGMGVEAEDRFTEVLERELSGWRVDNLGMTGWGIDLMVRALESFGSKARPDVVVLSVYTDDFRRVLPLYAGAGFEIPKYELEEGELVSVPYDFPRGWRRLHLVHAVHELYWNRIVDRNRFALNEALLNRFASLTEELGARPVVIFLPGKGDTEEDRKRRRFLKEWAAAHEMAHLDLTTVIHGAGVDKTYIREN